MADTSLWPVVVGGLLALVVRLLVASTDNEQICHAGLCHMTYLPPLIASHGHLMPPDKLKALNKVVDSYKR
jgi:hypothetical protein